MRIVSLLPSATEIVGALGALDQLVGITHECDWPAVVASRARVTSCSIDSTRTPREIDTQVRELSHAGAPLYTLKERLIRDLHPDVILTQALCEVCAVHEGDVRTLAASLPGPATVVTLSATSLDGVLDDVRRVGETLGIGGETDELLQEPQDLPGRIMAEEGRLVEDFRVAPRGEAFDQDPNSLSGSHQHHAEREANDDEPRLGAA
jgi:iron complex transport system substrate-binding protein